MLGVKEKGETQAHFSFLAPWPFGSESNSVRREIRRLFSSASARLYSSRSTVLLLKEVLEVQLLLSSLRELQASWKTRLKYGEMPDCRGQIGNKHR